MSLGVFYDRPLLGAIYEVILLHESCKCLLQKCPPLRESNTGPFNAESLQLPQDQGRYPIITANHGYYPDTVIPPISGYPDFKA